MTILTARTTRGREKTAINAMRNQVKTGNLDIKALFHPDDLQGYIFLEGKEQDIKDLVNDSRNARGVIEEKVEISEIEKYLDEEQEEIKIEEGDTVEVISGPFKGEKAKIERVDDTNREVTIELIDAAVPIPTTVDIDTVRRKANQ
jgi:transcriptional antiterminator NusG